MQFLKAGLGYSYKKIEMIAIRVSGRFLLLEMYAVDRHQEIIDATQERINDFLSRFKSNDIALASTDPATENGLDQYLLERAAEELRAARESVDKFQGESGKG